MEFVIFFALLVVLALITQRFGFDSRPSLPTKD